MTAPEDPVDGPEDQVDEPDDEPESWSTRFGEIEFEDDDSPQVADDARRRNGRVLAVLVAVGGAVALAVGVLAVVLVNHYLDDTNSLTARMSIKYQNEFRDCLDNGVDRPTCGTAAGQDCAKDPGWRSDPDRVADVARICLFR